MKHYSFMDAPRCHAKSKRSGIQCKSPAVRGKKVCRMHGGSRGSGAPKNNVNALKTGIFTKEMEGARKDIIKIRKVIRNRIGHATVK